MGSREGMNFDSENWRSNFGIAGHWRNDNFATAKKASIQGEGSGAQQGDGYGHDDHLQRNQRAIEQRGDRGREPRNIARHTPNTRQNTGDGSEKPDRKSVV